MEGGWAVCGANNQRDPEDLFHNQCSVVLPAELAQRRRWLLRQGGGRHFEMALLGND